MPSMPSALDQWKMTERENTPALVARWMLAPHLGYEAARDRYEDVLRGLEEGMGYLSK